MTELAYINGLRARDAAAGPARERLVTCDFSYLKGAIEVGFNYMQAMENNNGIDAI